MMQSNSGLLGGFLGGGQSGASAAAPGDMLGLGGLLGANGAQGAAPASNGGLQMAQQLSQSPTPETARQIIAQLHQMKSPEAAQFEQMIGNVMGNPQALKQLADAVVQKLGGGNA